MKTIPIQYVDTKKYTIEILNDDCQANNPRDWDNLGTMVYAHPNYTLGDEQIDTSLYENWEEVATMLYKERNAAIVLPLAIYDHSGVTMWVGSKWQGIDARWDCSDVGFIYVDKETLRKEYNTKRITKKILETAERVLRGEVETYDMYLKGEVYGIRILDEAGEEIDACWGYYGEEGIKAGVIDMLPDALPENVTMKGIGWGGEEYDTNIDYSDCKKVG